jgi:hypothetical protein
MNKATAQIFDLSGQVAIIAGGANGIGASYMTGSIVAVDGGTLID